PLLRRTAITRVLDHRRRSQCRPVLVTGSDVDPQAPASSEASSIDLSLLTHEQRTCFILFYWEGLSVKEIASELRTPENTVKTWMHRGRAKLRDSLPAHEGHP
ncbi:MAG TPA: sigma-70 family RNA polymerase sigma factor, partial [Planctomycetota bacterium]|nr:sigma-70 family RNA polymerase sigma factor [Planctomycetota bacterium]